jgi:hypothetical protein
LIDFDNNTEPQTQTKIAQSEVIDFNNMFATQPNKKNQSSFSFIKKNDVINNNHHSHSARDSTTTNNNFKYNETHNSVSTSTLIDLTSSENLKDSKFKETANNIFKLYNETNETQPSHKQNSLSYNHMLDKNLYNNPQISQPFYSYNQYNQPNTSNYSINSNLFLNDLYNKSTTESKLGASYNIDPISLKTNKLDNKNHDPFKGLVNFK